MSSTGQLPEPRPDAGRGGTEEAPAAERLDRLDADATKGLDVRVVGVAYDGSPESKQALRKARLLADAPSEPQDHHRRPAARDLDQPSLPA